MKGIRELVGHEMKWAQPKAMKREFELRDGDELVATLAFRSSFGSLARLETADGSWTFKRVGVWQPKVTVWLGDTEQEIAEFRNHTWRSGGTLKLADGRLLRASTHFWSSRYEWIADDDVVLVQYHKIGGVLHRSAMMEITAAGGRWAELPWLAALGWYLSVLMHEDAGGAAAAAAAAAG